MQRRRPKVLTALTLFVCQTPLELDQKSMMYTFSAGSTATGMEGD
jgi:hypothetical protein